MRVRKILGGGGGGELIARETSSTLISLCRMAFLKTSLSVSKAHFRVPGSSTGEKWNQSPAPNVCAFDKKVNEISLKLQSVLVFLPVSACTSGGGGGEGRSVYSQNSRKKR